MENLNLRTLTANRNGLNLGLGTKFDVAPAIEAMVQVPTTRRPAHPQRSQQRCVHMRHVPISARSIGHESHRGAWPTESASSLARAYRFDLGRLADDRFDIGFDDASKRKLANSKRDDRAYADRRFEPFPGRPNACRETIWSRS
jgi:hypothetical protein